MIGFDDPRTGTPGDKNQDLLFTGDDPAVDTVNTNGFAVGTNNQSIIIGETLCLDFVTNIDLTVSDFDGDTSSGAVDVMLLPEIPEVNGDVVV